MSLASRPRRSDPMTGARARMRRGGHIKSVCSPASFSRALSVPNAWAGPLLSVISPGIDWERCAAQGECKWQKYSRGYLLLALLITGLGTFVFWGSGDFEYPFVVIAFVVSVVLLYLQFRRPISDSWLISLSVVTFFLSCGLVYFIFIRGWIDSNSTVGSGSAKREK